MGTIDLRSLLGNRLLVHTGDGEVEERDSISHLDGKVVGIYFSAHWCPPCRGFTPRLREVYNELMRQGKPFEIIFVSSDRSEDEFNGYFEEMPWAAVPHEATAVRGALSKAFKVMGIPTFAVVSPEGRVLSQNARGAVTSDPTGAKFPWEGMEDAGHCCSVQ